jgi:exodeoxyribonuclease VII large subunit
MGRERLLGAAQTRQGRRRLGLEALGARLHALSPLAVLARGYSLAQRASDGAILRSSREIAAGEEIRVRLADGALRATVTEAEKT